MMAPLNLTELAQIAISLQALVGAQLQECVQSANEIGLGFYHDRQMVWLWFDLHPQRPVVLKLDSAPVRKKVPRPLTLFIRSRFEGKRLSGVRADVSKGRVLVFEFFADEPLELEAWLIPHNANVTARAGQSQVSEHKPKSLPQQNFAPRDDDVVRSWDEIKAEWLKSQAKPAQNQAPTDAVQREKKWRKAIEKKRDALARMDEELKLKLSGEHRELGEWLKSSGTLEDVPSHLAALVSRDRSLAENIQNAFHRAKENERKAEGTRARIAQVQAELQELEAMGPAKYGLATSASPKQSLLAKADARGRRFSVSSDLEAFIGKSASDNLAILRRAQPFDYWLHLRDFPGSHAILRRARNRNVTDQEFQDTARWVIEQSLGKRATPGDRFDVLIVECRFVRPIKGDKLGRVNYSNDRVMTVRY